MEQFIIYPNEDGSIAVMGVDQELTIEETGRKHTPANRPFLIVNIDDFPQHYEYFLDAIEADFSNPDGYGIGIKAWLAEQDAKKQEVVEDDNNQPE